MKPGDLVIGMLPGIAETKVRPAVVIASQRYLLERPDSPGWDRDDKNTGSFSFYRLRPPGLASRRA